MPDNTNSNVGSNPVGSKPVVPDSSTSKKDTRPSRRNSRKPRTSRNKAGNNQESLPVSKKSLISGTPIVSVSTLKEMKGKQPIVGLTAYDSIMGHFVSKAGVDFILVGDSVGTTMLGHKTTIPVTISDMIHHTAAVRRGEPNCLLVADLPFGEASLSFDRLLESARALMQKGGADAVKIEGGKDIADDIEKLVATGIPVLGHIGLLPQTVKAIGGYRKFGSQKEEAESLYTDAISLEEAGVFAIIGEMIEEDLASELSRQVLPPLIGIGSGERCDGQILVTPDLLGWSNGPVPSFVKQYADLNHEVSVALNRYVKDVKGRKKAR